MIEHIMASASVPLLYDYQWVPKDYDYLKAKRGEKQDPTRQNSRRFWDGALLSNTPTRELISHHKLFWEKITSIEENGKTLYQMRTERDKRKREQYAEKLFEMLWNEVTAAGTPQLENKLTADNLDIYIINLWPTEEKALPLHDDYDLTRDRMYDVANHDKTKYDLKVATFVTDYIELTRNLIQQLAKSGDMNKEAARKILLNDDSKTRSKFREGVPRKYLDLLIGRFDVTEKLRIERTEKHEITISNKWVDLTRETIMSLREQGEKEAQKEITNKQLSL